MANPELPLNKDDKQIEDVIDARKSTGQYDICINSKSSQNLLCRRPWSAPASAIYDEGAHISVDDIAVWISEGDLCSYPVETGMLTVGPTDSEITVVRVKREGLRYKTRENKWNLHDDAVPGDGTHLGESPSLVNLVTLVGQSLQSYENKTDEYNEYLVPLSSWDPSDNPHHLPDVQSAISTNTLRSSYGEQSKKSKFRGLKLSGTTPARHHGLAGRISNFLRKRWTKRFRASVYESVTKNVNSNENIDNQTNVCERNQNL